MFQSPHLYQSSPIIQPGAEYAQNHYRNLVNPPNNTYRTPNRFVLDVLDSMEFFLPFQYLYETKGL